jgi:hypothetical protein
MIKYENLKIAAIALLLLMQILAIKWMTGVIL